ncbi:hypothetical protein OE903_06210 [Bacillus sp. B6(2022)]|nr:hypothetical protein [Bacillus sp. B6(2022)]
MASKNRKLSSILSKVLFEPSFQQQVHQFIHLDGEMEHYKKDMLGLLIAKKSSS